jgi:protein TonB
MIYTQRKKDPTTRVIGIVGIAVVMALVYWVLLGMIQKKEVIFTPPVQVDIQEKKEEIKEEEVKLDVEQPEIKIQEVQMEIPKFDFDVPVVNAPVAKIVEKPVEAPKPAPVAPPKPVQVYVIKPKPDQQRFQEMLAENYPPALIRKKIGGDVGVSFCIDVNGKITDPKLTSSSGEESLDNATVKNITRVRFTPAKDSTGKNVAICNPPFELTVAWRPPER